MPYLLLQFNGETVGELGAFDPDTPAGTPAHWLVYFQVSDTDVSARQATPRGAGATRLAPA